jgi:hypothetical protein
MFEQMPISKTSLSVKSNEWYVFSFTNPSGVSKHVLTVSFGLNMKFESATLDNVSDKDDLMIGFTNRFFPGANWNGEFAEVIIYTRLLSQAERNQVITYLMQKFNIQ